MTKQSPSRNRSWSGVPFEDADPRIVESDHRIANSLSLTSGLLRMQRHQSTDETVRTALLSAEARVASIASLHRYLYRHGADDRIDLAQYLAEVLPEIGGAVGLRCVLVVDGCSATTVSGRVATRLTIIVNELALNAHKHAYGGREGGCMTVELESDGGSMARLTVADGGAGLPDRFDPAESDGLGMWLVHSLISELGASLSTSSERGARFVITFSAG